MLKEPALPKPDLIADLRAAVAAQGLAAGTARPRTGKPGVTLIWQRPEPVTLRADAKGVLMLSDYLPFVAPGGRLHRDIKAWLAEHAPDALCTSRNGHLSLGVAALGDWAAALATLLSLTAALRSALAVTWPDYANGVFARELV